MGQLVYTSTLNIVRACCKGPKMPCNLLSVVNAQILN